MVILPSPPPQAPPPPLELKLTLIDYRSGYAQSTIHPSITTQVYTDAGPPPADTSPQKTLCTRLVKVIEQDAFDITPYQSRDSMIELVEALLKRTRQTDTWLKGVKTDGTCEEE
jgi:hypothetical protein